MGLIDIIKESGKRARGLALAGALGLSGCLTTPQEAARLIVKPVLTGDFSDWDKPGQMSPQGNNASGGNGNYPQGSQNQFYSLDNSSHLKQLVQEDSNYKISTPFGDLVIVCCNYSRDFNDDGVISYPEEYVGVKTAFGRGERITISLRSNRVFNVLRAELLDSSGKKVDESGVLKDLFGLSVSYNLNVDELAKIREQRPDGKIPDDAVFTLLPNNYRVVWYSGNELVAMKDFQVGF